MVLEITNLTKTKINKALLCKTAQRVLKNKKSWQQPLSVVLVGQKLAKALNKKYRKKNYVPNVLTFGYGEIVLCPKVISRDAKKYGILFEQELVRVFSHGLFHLLGYSHKEIERKSKLA